MDYAKMYSLYRYVYDTPDRSEERARRLAELNDEDSENLFHFTVEMMSGKIDKNKIPQGSDAMDFKTYEKLKHTQLLENDRLLDEFSRQYPGVEAQYLQRESEKRKKQKEVLAIKDRGKRLRAIAANMDAFT